MRLECGVYNAVSEKSRLTRFQPTIVLSWATKDSLQAVVKAQAGNISLYVTPVRRINGRNQSAKSENGDEVRTKIGGRRSC